MRRCMESGNCQFGMVLSPDSKYGTMLRINSFNQMPDGRHVNMLCILMILMSVISYEQ